MKRILVILPFTEMISGEHRAICPTETVEAEESGTATLQSHLDPWLNVVNLTVDWKRVDLNNKLVHIYRHGRDHPDAQVNEYRGRTTLNHENLKAGILTLQISSVRPSDSGRYKCFVPKWRASCTIDLVVVRRDQENRTKMDAASTTIPPPPPPLEQVTKMDVPDGENRMAVRAAIISSVFFFPCFLVAAVVALKRRKVRVCKRGQQEETNPDNLEMENLRTKTAEGDEDAHSAAENGFKKTSGSPCAKANDLPECFTLNESFYQISIQDPSAPVV
ncbi:uncharacterized protein ABDE67_019914 [Symphorus nematophorus]